MRSRVGDAGRIVSMSFLVVARRLAVSRRMDALSSSVAVAIDIAVLAAALAACCLLVALAVIATDLTAIASRSYTPG